MSRTTYEQPAFPTHGTMGEVVNEGMSLRDYFAGKAMAAVITNCGPMDGDTSSPGAMPMASEEAPTVDEVARYAYAQADAMLKARAA